MSNELNQVIKDIVSSPEYWKVNYYMRSMKKAPHGGVFHLKYPNVFLKYYTLSAYQFFVPRAEIPSPIVDFYNMAKAFIENANIGVEELLRYSLGVSLDKPKHNDGNKMYVANCGKVITSDGRSEIEHMIAVGDAIEGRINFLDNFTIDYDRLIYLFVLSLIEDLAYRIKDVNEVVMNEQLEEPTDKYGLTDVSKAEFEKRGFILEDKYYLYNIFFDTSIGSPISQTPNSIDIIQNIETDIEIRMRCDRNLAVPVNKMVSTATVDFQKWRGITLEFDNIKDQMINGRETIVHYDEETMHKILVYIKQGTDETGKEFYHLNVEQLWNPDMLTSEEEVIITNYVHGTYYPEIETFEHIDFSVNQYAVDVYKAKYLDAKETTGVSIGEYGNYHYKIWCIRGENLTPQIWSNLVCATLDVPFRSIFMETIGGTYKDEE